MSSYIIDYDAKKNVAILISNNLDLIREQFSVEDVGAKIARKIRGSFISIRKFAITPSGRFEVGLVPDIYKKIRQIDPDGTIQITSPIKRKISPKLNAGDDVINTSSYTLRPYQEEAVKMCMERGRGISVIATAGGKTIIMSSLISTLIANNKFKKIVLLLPTHLAKQTYDEFISYNPRWTLTWWTGEHLPDKECNVIIVGSNIALSKIQDTTWLTDADVLMVDEVHTLRHSNKINKLIKKFKTSYRFGFTGTMPDDPLDRWTVKGLIGPVIMEKKSIELRNQKYISDVIVQILKIKYRSRPAPSNPSSLTSQYVAEKDFLMHNTFRTNIINKISAKCDNNILILVDRIEHGEILFNNLSGIPGKSTFYIKGAVDTIERERIKTILEQNNNSICIAISSIFSTGINIKNLHYIFFAAGGKAKVKIVQSIGRGLRLHNDKKRLVIFDISDNLKYSERHHTRRISLYEKEKIKYKIKQITEPKSG